MPSFKRVLRFSVLALGMLIAPACATIVGGGPSQGLSVTSEPTGSRFTIKAASGMQYAAGTTPQMVRIPRKNDYTVEFAVDGYRPQSAVLTKGINNWIWGNLLIFWIVGFGVDFISGSAYKLEPEQVSVTLQRALDESGVLQLYGVVRELTKDGKLIREQRVRLVPVQ